MFSFLSYSKIAFKKYINPLSTIILFILAFDILVLGLIFGNAKLIERYAETSIVGEGVRIELQEFGFLQFKKFWLFGYGSGGFETVYKLFYNILPGEALAKHTHNDGIELIGEVGIIGILILFSLLFIYFKKLNYNIKDSKEFIRCILISSLLVILFVQSFVDFSLHIPGVSTFLIVLLSIGLINFKNKSI